MKRRDTLKAFVGAAALPALASCGFKPLYGGAVGEVLALEMAAIEVVAPDTRLGWTLRTQLVDLLNPKGLIVAPRYRLALRLEQRQKALGVQLNDVVTRFDLTLATFFSLSVAGEGPEPIDLYRSAVRRIASYNVIREPFAVLIAEREAEERAAHETALQVRSELALYFEERTR